MQPTTVQKFNGNSSDDDYGAIMVNVVKVQRLAAFSFHFTFFPGGSLGVHVWWTRKEGWYSRFEERRRLWEKCVLGLAKSFNGFHRELGVLVIRLKFTGWRDAEMVRKRSARVVDLSVGWCLRLKERRWLRERLVLGRSPSCRDGSISCRLGVLVRRLHFMRWM